MEANEAVESMSNLSAPTSLFRHDCVECGERWSKFSNHDEEEGALMLSTSSASIIHRHVLQRKKWITESFTIQNSDMRAHLETALANYQDFELGLENWTFTPPFKPLVHCWDRLNNLFDRTTDPLRNEAINRLIVFLRPILTSDIEALATTRETGKVTFEDIWHIFPPGELALTTFYGVEAVCRVIKYEKVRKINKIYYVISLEYIDWNGEQCGYATTTVTIDHFAGQRYVVGLPVYPISFNESASQIKSRIINRGQRFESLRGYHYQTCAGNEILLGTSQPEERHVRPLNWIVTCC